MFVRSFIEVRKLCLIMFPLIFVLQLYNTWSYWIQIIFKQIYLTCRWDTNRYYHLGLIAIKGYLILPKSSELEPFTIRWWEAQKRINNLVPGGEGLPTLATSAISPKWRKDGFIALCLSCLWRGMLIESKKFKNCCMGNLLLAWQPWLNDLVSFFSWWEAKNISQQMQFSIILRPPYFLTVLSNLIKKYYKIHFHHDSQCRCSFMCINFSL